MKTWKWNLSYSTYADYKESQLAFYFKKISGMKPTDETIGIYGDSGNVVHKFAQKIIEEGKTSEQFKQEFVNEWKKYNLHKDTGLNGKVMDINLYFELLKNAEEIINEEIVGTGKITCEQHIEFRKEEYQGILIKGFVDVVVVREDGVYMYDWKTNTSYDYELHRLQRLFYSWLYYIEFGIIPKKCIWKYLKGRDEDSSIHEEVDSFTLEEVMNFDAEIKKFIDTIIEKGNDITKYEVGNIDSPFNNFKTACRKEIRRRNSQDKIFITRRGDSFTIETKLDDRLVRFIDKTFSFRPDGYFWVDSFKNGQWDGYKRLFKQQKTLPIGFYNKFHDIISSWNKLMGTNYEVEVDEDKRQPSIVESSFKTKFKESPITLHYYQEDAVKVGLEKKIGILYLGTAAGKTYISAEIIKRANKRSLFIIDRQELVYQTADEYEDYLGVKVGRMVEGELDISNQITVASIQTIIAILKRKNEETTKLLKYLFNVTMVIFDEAQGVSDAGMYGDLLQTLKNVDYIIGTTGSPHRSGADTLMMNALVGFPEYSKTTKELEDEGYICPTKSYFIKILPRDFNDMGDYHENYVYHIVEHDLRNKIAVDHIEKNREKKILVLVNRVEHGKKLSEMIPNSYFLHGESKKDERKEKYKEFKETNNLVLIAMVKIAAKGLDLPSLDIMWNLSAHKSSIDTSQSIGRLKRKSKDKEFGYYFDLFDASEQFIGATKERIKILEQYGNEVKVMEYTGEKT